MRKTRLVCSTILAASAIASLPGAASAQEASSTPEPPGFALNRFNPSDRGSDWFVLDSLDMRGNLRPAFGIVADYAYQPLVSYTADDEPQTVIVHDQLFGHLGASLALWDSIRLGLTLPIALVNTGDSTTVNGTTYTGPSGVAMGDMRLSGTVRFYGEYGDPFTAGLGLSLFLPTGSSSMYTSDDALRGVPSLSVAGTTGSLAYAARLGAQFRPTRAGFDDGTGTEIQYGASVGMRLMENKLLIGPEIYGSSVVSSTNVSTDGREVRELAGKQSTSVEAVLGAHYAMDSGVKLGFGAGAGLAKGYGTPTARVLGTIEWAMPYDAPKPGPEPVKLDPVVELDRDKDTIFDKDDACLLVFGVKSEDPKKHGCPLPDDKDKDTIPDTADACPLEAGVKSQDPKKHGCPLPEDPDKDGFIADDACPFVAGVKSNDPKKQGCPPPSDRDKDGLVDSEDKCPDEPGVLQPDRPEKNGCPRVVIIEDKITVPPIEFDQGKSNIRPDAELILFELLQFLKAPERAWIKKVSIEGHTNDDGNPVANRTLSKARAASVVKWLTARGIDPRRLTSTGYGQDKPLIPHGSADAKEKNRRVEYIIIDPKSTEKK